MQGIELLNKLNETRTNIQNPIVLADIQINEMINEFRAKGIGSCKDDLLIDLDLDLSLTGITLLLSHVSASYEKSQNNVIRYRYKQNEKETIVDVSTQMIKEFCKKNDTNFLKEHNLHLNEE